MDQVDHFDLDAHRDELVAYCYRMSGSITDAEDLVQDTMLRAWKARDRYDSRLASVRTWLYRIATNTCLSELQRRRRRPLPSGLGPASEDPAAPLSPALDVQWLEPFPDSRFNLTLRSDMRLAVVVALQVLSPRQRAALLLREVVGFTAAEVAAQLNTSVPAVNSAIQRARAALAGARSESEVGEPDDPHVRATVERYMRAFEAADVEALVAMLAEEVILEMPPVPLWYRGRRHYELFMRRVFDMRGSGWHTTSLTANSQPAFAAYAPDPAGGHRLHTIQVLTLSGALVTGNVVFADPRLWGPFGLPEHT